jgi:hypothetical protein
MPTAALSVNALNDNAAMGDEEEPRRNQATTDGVLGRLFPRGDGAQ